MRNRIRNVSAFLRLQELRPAADDRFTERPRFLIRMRSLGEEVLRLVRCLFLATDGNSRSGVRRVVLCGVDDADGSNLLCARVGRTFADKLQSQVCVVDANPNTPEHTPLFDLPPFDSHQRVSESAQKTLRQVADDLGWFPVIRQPPIPARQPWNRCGHTSRHWATTSHMW